jgi:predicted TIM-barrel fold metal-dependent hydrolase
MPIRADSHIHLFRPGYAAKLPESCQRVQPDEVTLYRALSEQAGVQQALVVGFEGEPWAAGNNRYLAQQAAMHAWIRPVAYVNDPAQLDDNIGAFGAQQLASDDIDRLNKVSEGMHLVPW